jgi:hypothetical protein
MKARSKAGLKVKNAVKAGGNFTNHNLTQLVLSED